MPETKPSQVADALVPMRVMAKAIWSFTGEPGSPVVYFGILGSAAPPAGAVPEPASWALMIVGMGVAGGALRRRRSAAVTP